MEIYEGTKMFWCVLSLSQAAIRLIDADRDKWRDWAVHYITAVVVPCLQHFEF